MLRPSPDRRLLPWIFFASAVLLGVIGGFIWEKLVVLPNFVITDHLQAIPVPERELNSWFAADFWFSIIGIVIGLILGIWSWLWFAKTGWVVTLFATMSTVLAAAVCWRAGVWLAPESFELRLARAKAGDVIPISFELRAWSALFLWPLAGIVPVMLMSVFTADAEDDDDDEPVALVE